MGRIEVTAANDEEKYKRGLRAGVGIEICRD